MDRRAEAIARGWAQAQIETKDALAIATAERDITQMDYDNTVAGVDAPAPATEKEIIAEQLCPFLGRVAYLPGRIISIEHPRTEAEVATDKERGIDMAFEWNLSSHASRRDIGLLRIYIGIKASGPLAVWSRNDKWHIILSHGNFGKNWACGGNWRNLNPTKDMDKIIEQINALPQDIKDVVWSKE